MKPRPMTDYEKRREKLEKEGLTTSDAQAVIEAEDKRKTMKEDFDLKALTVRELIALFASLEKRGEIDKDDVVLIASDEEGNSYSTVCLRGIERTKGKLILYPLFQKLEEEVFRDE